MEPGLHRAGGYAKSLGYLLNWQVPPVPQYDDDPLVGRQPGEGGLEREPGIRGSVRVGCRHLGGVVEGNDANRPGMPHPVAADVDEDPVEPGVEPIHLAQCSPTRPGPGDSFLRRVFGLVAIAQDQGCEPVALQESRVIEGGERLEAFATPGLGRAVGETPAAACSVGDPRAPPDAL